MFFYVLSILSYLSIYMDQLIDCCKDLSFQHKHCVSFT